MTLQSKAGIVFGILISLMVIHGWYSISLQRTIMEEESRQRASVLLSTLAEMAQDSLVSRQFDRLETQVDSLLTHSDVQFARIIDTSGRVVADTDRGRQGWVLTRATEVDDYREVGADLTVGLPIVLEGSDGRTRPIGRAELGISLLRLHERSFRISTVLLSFLIVQILIGTLFGMYLHLQVVRPLDVVAHSVESLVPGRDAHQIATPPRAASEIITVAEAINAMRARLEHYHREEREQQRLRTLGEISVSLAHEIRNPLEAVGGAVEVLRTMSGTRDEQIQFYDIISEEVSNLNRYVSEFLRYGRFDIPDEQEWDLRKLAEDAILLVSPLSNQRRITIALQNADMTIPVVVSADQIKRVLVNLLMNALEASPSHTVVSVSTTKTLSAGLVNIDDNGPGIAENVAGHLFEPFVTTKEHGAGLGLAICRTIVEHHGGSISITDRSAGGCSARVTIPIQGTGRCTPLRTPYRRDHQDIV